MIKITPSVSQDFEEAILLCKNEFKAETPVYGKESVAVRYRGELGVIVGVHRPWNGVAEVWAVTTKNMYKAPIAYIRALMRLTFSFVTQENIHKLQITVRADNKEFVNFATYMGFYTEGLLMQYGPDRSDYFIMGRVF